MLFDNSASKAESHINRIREDFNLNNLGSSRHIQNLDRALDVLSDQLYQKPTHFLLELIQNADDNEYQTNEPTLSFTYENRRLRVDCNEKGFSEANVEAICRIGCSTKSGLDAATRYVGEKGIGFKSVFKIADKVWISSNGYSFKFDKTQPLGMIAPQWEPFPQSRTPTTTSMLLELSSSYDETRLVTELKRLDSRMLIFLQRLRRIDVQINMTGEPTWVTSLKKFQSTSPSLLLVGQTRDSKTFSYMVSRHRAENMPSDPKREGVRNSEVLIAFPTLDDTETDLEFQQVYAFLPIRDYGFKFLLQADFVLSASREDILSDSPWNVALRDCFVKAFVDLVKNSDQSSLHYNWPLFLPDESHPDSFFKPARKAILKQLSRDRIVENYLGSPTIARRLLHVPQDFRAENGSPLLNFKSTSTLFLSDQYREPCLEPLEKVGLRKMCLKDFVATLQELLKTDCRDFQNASSEWHTEFARVLLSALWKEDSDKSQRKILRNMSIIPLENNTWVSPAEAGLFLPPDVSDRVHLEDVAIKLVLNEAASDESRAALYKYLDIPTIDKSTMCRYIAAVLCKNWPPPSISGDNSVSQTLFLFKAGWRNPLGQDMWFQNQAGSLSRGSELYLSSTSKYSMSSYYGSTDVSMFVHEKYYIAAQAILADVEEFKTWLQDCLHVWEIPRLLTVNSMSYSPAGCLSINKDFRRLGERNKGPSWIYLLRDNYQKYAVCFDPDQLSKSKLYATKITQPIEKLRDEHRIFVDSIGYLRVRCVGGKFQELNKTYLPHPSVVEDSNGYISLADVSDPENADWQYLKKLGLGVEPDLKLYLRCLEELSRLERLSLDSGQKQPDNGIEAKIARCLDQIQARHTEDTDMVKYENPGSTEVLANVHRNNFRQKLLIRVPPVNANSNHRWVKTGNCLWAGEKCFRILPVLKEHYPGHQTLFNKVLGCGDAQLADVYTEATHFRLEDDLEHIKAIFCEIERRLRNEETDPQNWFGRFASNAIFPVASGTGILEPSEGFNRLCKVEAAVEWYIADRDSLYRSFKQRLPLLSFPVGVIRHLKKTMGRMKLDRYRLSRHAQSRAKTEGVTTFDADLTTSMLSRVPYILRLIPTLIPTRTKRRIARHLRSLKVSLADKLTQEWSLKLRNNQLVEGRPYAANVVFVTANENSLDIFLSRRYLARSICKNDVVQHFADFCEIQDHTHLLSMALWEGLDEVEHTFQAYGVPDYDPLIDSDEPLDEDEDDDEVPLNDAIEPQISQLPSIAQATQQTLEAKGRLSNTKGPAVLGRGAQQNVHDKMPGTFCSHCAKPALRFTGVEWRSVFVATGRLAPPGTGLEVVRLVQTAKPANPPPKSRGLLNFIKKLGCHSRPADNDDDINSVPVNTNEIDLQYKGEQFFSTTLTTYLGQNYNPETHWTSGLRARAGHKSFIGSSTTHASFTLPDPTGTVTRLMLKEYPDVAATWATQPPTWHFEVKTTAGNLDSPFHLTNAQVDRARVFSTATSTTQIPKNVSVLVRVFNAAGSTTPQANLYRDPWEMFVAGDISLKADTVYRCSIATLGAVSSESGVARSDHNGRGGGGNGSANGVKSPPSYYSQDHKV